MREAPKLRWPTMGMSLALLLTLGLLIFAAACGDDDDDGDSETPAGTDTPEPTEDLTRFEGETITVATFSGHSEKFQEGVGRLLEEQTGATIEWIEGQPPDFLAQLIASRGSAPPFDIVMLDPYSQWLGIQQGVLMPIDTDAMPNLQDLPEVAFSNPGYGPNYFIIRMGLCYNTEKFAEVGADSPQSIDAFWDPTIAGHVLLPGPDWNGSTLFHSATAAHLGYDVSQPDEVVAKLSEIDIFGLQASSGAAEQNYLAGDVWMNFWTDGRCIGLQQQGEPLEFVPGNWEIDGETYTYVLAGDTIDIVEGTDQPELAEILVNLMFTEEGLLPLAKEIVYTPSPPGAYEAMLADPATEPFMVPPDELEAMYNIDWSEYDPVHDQWVDAFNRGFQ